MHYINSPCTMVKMSGESTGRLFLSSKSILLTNTDIVLLFSLPAIIYNLWLNKTALETRFYRLKKSTPSPGWVAWLVGAWSYPPKGCGFIFWAGHIPIMGSVPGGALQEATNPWFPLTSMCFFSLSFSSLFLILSLKHQQNHILWMRI